MSAHARRFVIIPAPNITHVLLPRCRLRRPSVLSSTTRSRRERSIQRRCRCLTQQMMGPVGYLRRELITASAICVAAQRSPVPMQQRHTPCWRCSNGWVFTTKATALCSVVVNMGRKAASTSTRVNRPLVREPGRTRRSARTAHTPRSRDGRMLDRSLLGAGPKATDGPRITNDFPEFVAVRDRELEAIEAYLGACLDAMLGGTD